MPGSPRTKAGETDKAENGQGGGGCTRRWRMYKAVVHVTNAIVYLYREPLGFIS